MPDQKPRKTNDAVERPIRRAPKPPSENNSVQRPTAQKPVAPPPKSPKE